MELPRKFQVERMELPGVEIDSVSVLLDKIKNKILTFVSASSRGKRMSSYGTSPRICTVDYGINRNKDKRGSQARSTHKTIGMGNVP